jgi:chemotaxis protein methyltransferase CheR
MDVVFCRNVLIYFDDKAKQKAVSLLYDSLRPGGFLFIGSSESLHSVTRAFKPIVFNKVVAYQRV